MSLKWNIFVTVSQGQKGVLSMRPVSVTTDKELRSYSYIYTANYIIMYAITIYIAGYGGYA